LTLVSIFVLVALSVSMAGIISEADCDDDCQSEKTDCCECICCPSNVVMAAFENFSVHFEYCPFLWTVDRKSFSSEQDWYTSIDHPPQNLS